jgi:hypothetical protein
MEARQEEEILPPLLTQGVGEAPLRTPFPR